MTALFYIAVALGGFGLGLLLGRRSRDPEVVDLAARLRWVEFERDVWKACSRRIHSNAKGQRDFFAEAFGAGGGPQ